MPRLDSNAVQLKYLKDKDWEVKRLLPDVDAIHDASAGAVSTTYLSAGYALDASYIWQESSQMALGNILQSVGMPLVEVYKDIIDKLDINVVSEVKDKLIQTYGDLQAAKTAMKTAGDSKDGGAAMGLSIDSGIGFAVNQLSNVPLGWVVKLAWNISKFIRGIVSLSKADKDKFKTKTIYPDSRFSPQLDNMILNDTLGKIRSTTNWSRLFGPPQLGSGQGTLPDYWVKTTESGAKEIYRKFGWSSDGQEMDWQSAGWTGMVPGTTLLHRGVRLKGNDAQDLGPSLMPSTQNVLFWLWKDIIGKKGNAGPAMYTIDTEELQYWRMYIHGLHQFLYETDEISGAQKNAVMKLLNTQMGKKVFGWGTKLKPTDNETDTYQPVKEADALLARQEAFLDTLLVAYIDDSWGALKHNDQLRDKWLSRRKDLLKHPARCAVDLKNVPDAEYVQALKDKGVDSPMCQQAAQSYAVAPLGPPEDVPEGQVHGVGGLTLGEKKVQPGSQGREIGYLPLLAVGVGVGAWYAYKKGVFQKLLK